jgi:hypothetical protein
LRGLPSLIIVRENNSLTSGSSTPHVAGKRDRRSDEADKEQDETRAKSETSPTRNATDTGDNDEGQPQRQHGEADDPEDDTHERSPRLT